MNPGFHELSWTAYRAFDAMNPSLLKVVANQSPRHALYAKNNPKDPTDDMVMGTLAHMLIFEPGRFAETVARFDGDGSKLTKAWREFRDAAEAGGKIPLHPTDEDEVQAWADAVAAHEKCAALIGLKGTTELTVVWNDPTTGVVCKSRIDRLIEGETPIVLEFKTAADGSPAALQRVATRHGWDIAAAMRIDAIKQLTGKRADYWFIVVEKSAPYVVTPYRCGADLEELGRVKYTKALTDWRACLQSGVYRGYSVGGLELNAPLWELRAYEVEVGNEQ